MDARFLKKARIIDDCWWEGIVGYGLVQCLDKAQVGLESNPIIAFGKGLSKKSCTLTISSKFRFNNKCSNQHSIL